MDGDEFDTLLHCIAERLDGENIKMIRYLCKDGMPKAKNFDDGFDLLFYMKEKLWITHSDMEYLAEILYWINRRDLLKLLPGVKSRKDYETNYLLKDRYFTPFRITCFLVTQELLPEDFKILKNFCRNKLSLRNLQRSDDIYRLFDCLEEEDIFCEGDLKFMLICLQRLDNQKPFKLFQSLSLGDHSMIYPAQNLQLTEVTNHGFPRLTHSLPNFSANSASAVYYLAPSSYQGFSPYASTHNSFNNHAMQRDVYKTYNDNTNPYKAGDVTTDQGKSNITADGCAVANGPAFNEGLKFFTDDNRTQPSSKQHFQISDNCKSFITTLEESNPKSVRNSFNQISSNDVTQSKNVYSSDNYSNVGKAFSETLQSSEAQCSPDSFTEPTMHLQSVDEHLYTHSHAETNSAVSRNDVIDGGPSVDLSTSTIDFKGRVERYNMNSSPTGICLIINNMNFEQNFNVAEAERRLKLKGHDYPVPNVGLKNRVGSAQDIDKVSNLFKSFGFHIMVREDLDSRAMLHLLANVSRKDHSAYDCFVLIMMSHGALGSIYGVDGMPVRCAEIKSIFKPASCPTLLNKPKILFFQACQGEQTMDGHSTAPVADIADVETDGHGVLPTSNTPSEADFLICYSTVPGYISYRSRTTGSFFINYVVDNLQRLHETEDVLSIMTNVNLQLANHSLNQTAMPVSTLRKKIFFRMQNN